MDSFINNSLNYIGSIWQFGDGTSSTLDNPIHTYPAATIDSYNVMLVVYDANGCTDTAYSVVESNDLVRLTVPNGWEVIRHVADSNAAGPSDDDLMAIADAVREAATAHLQPSQSGVAQVAHSSVGRRGHLRAVPS